MRKMIQQRILSFDLVQVPHSETPLRDSINASIIVKRVTDSKVTALWPGSALHYMQVLAENRWEDYNWKYERERYGHWDHGFSWIERPELDPLGVEEQESLKNTTTIPQKDSDLSFYLWKSPPLPRTVVTSGEMDESYYEPIPQAELVKVNGLNEVNGVNGQHGVNGAVNGVSNSPIDGTNGNEVSIVIPV
ncbi:hypothetical protein QQZ08_009400 [Neonectria magnoliae]|uniref:Uncharacterized protein n=1 Tax=Neonectria magnoliae TaxID=2732573 RepID=A0ABR1HNH7_9HYPO